MNILEALKALDTKNDNHWTADGLPRLDTVKMMAGDQSITRDQVSAAAPGFQRSNAADYTPPETPATPAQAAQPAAQPQQAAGQGDSGGEGPNAPQPEANAASATGASQGETEQPEVAGGAGSATDEIEALEAALAEKTASVDDLRHRISDLTKQFEAERQEEDDLRARVEKLRPRSTNADAIQDYLAAQRKRLEERGARQKLLAESGVDLKELAKDLKSPLDSAMARKTGRGGNRPGA